MGKPKPEDGPAGYKAEVGERLRLARIALGYQTLRRFAEDTDIDEDNLGNWERGISLVPPWYVRKLKGLVGIDPNWIYAGDAHRLPHDLAQKLAGPDKR